jgi:cation diffusion facilitator CzcD-associated flavoprotein CzcO
VSATPHHRIAIVGSGFSGLGMAVRLKQEGVHDFVVLERAKDLGGTWRDNTYPGCACDVPSNLYSFSFAPNPAWSETFSTQQEIWDYLRRVARERRVDGHIRYRHEVTAARWQAREQLWRVETTAGDLSAEMLIAGPGPLSDPKAPDIDGLEGFRGTIFHSAHWNHQHALDGERVAVIGTGASAIQLVPKIQPRVGRLHVFQRTPPWIVPHRNRRTSPLERALYRACPPAQRLARAASYCERELLVPAFMHPCLATLPERVARRHLHAQVADPELRARLEPSYRIGCKRIVISDDYYPALKQPNVELVSDRIRAITPAGILTADGVERELDTIILATGFRATDMPVAEWVRDGHGHTLAQAWQGSPRAYYGSAVAGFPNLFTLVGPNTGLGHNSIIFMIEAQIHYVLECLRHMDTHGLRVVEVRREVERQFNHDVQRRLQGTVWNSGGCASWYFDENGRNTTIWPGSTWPFRQRLRRFRAEDYSFARRAGAADPAAALAGATPRG